MKEICIIRHAKSDWGEDFVKDIDRPLSTRGLRDAYFMSECFTKNKSMPDLILSSTATRAYSTAMIFARSLNTSVEHIHLEPQIYEADVSTLMKVIQKQNNSYQSILLFGHNPGLTNLCNEISDDIFFENIPTCGIGSYQFPIKSWKEIGSKKGKLNFYEFPKNFKNYDL